MRADTLIINCRYEKRFLARSRLCEADADEAGCWNWKWCLDQSGYGLFGMDRTARKAHRVSYSICCGAIPSGILVLHKCDNPKCINPSHLFLGTQQDNIADMIQKRRNCAPKGSAHCFATLSDSNVRDIRARVASGETQVSVARSYGVCKQTVWKIMNNKIWRHVTAKATELLDEIESREAQHANAT